MNGSVEVSARALTLPDLAVMLLRARWLVIGVTFAGAVWGAAASLLSTRQFASNASFVPEESGGAASGLAATARQFGLTIPGATKGWSAGLYVDVLKSQQLMESIATDTVVVAELGDRRVALLDLMEIEAPSAALRVARGVRHLQREVVRVTESRNVGSVSVRAITPWPSVSQQVVRRMLDRVSHFNVSIRQTQAAEEARYAESMSDSAERVLRAAEDSLLRFLQENREIGNSPGLQFRRDRLQREVTMRQELYSSLVMTRDEARLRRVRDTPVISVIESPTLPVIGESRGTILRVMMTGFAGFALVLAWLLFRRVVLIEPQATATAADVRDEFAAILPARLRRRFRAPAPSS